MHGEIHVYPTSLTEVVVFLDICGLLVVEPSEVAVADAGTLQGAQDAQDVTGPHVLSQFVDVRGDVVGRHVQGRRRTGMRMRRDEGRGRACGRHAQSDDEKLHGERRGMIIE